MTLRTIELRIAVLLCLCLVPHLALAKSSYFTIWQDLYPDSLTGQNIIDGRGRSCTLCHQVDNGSAFNEYGWQIQIGISDGLTPEQAILAAEGYDSDLDPSGSVNLFEIEVHTQPGWTDGPHNRILFTDGPPLEGQLPADGILGLLDPGLDPACQLDTDCDDGLYCNGDESCDANGFCQPGSPPCATGDSCNEGADTCTAPPECYSNADCDDALFCNGVERCDAAGSCQPGRPPCAAGDSCDEGVDMCMAPPGCHSNADCDDALFCNGTEYCDAAGSCQPGSDPCAAGDSCDENANMCVAPALDLDIARLHATRRIGLRRVKPATVKLVLWPASSVAGQATATLVGTQNGSPVFTETKAITVEAAKVRVNLVFSYTPTAAGLITWTATVDDGNPDIDEAQTTTLVK